MSARPLDPLMMFSLDRGYADRDRDGCQSSLLTISPFLKRLDAFCYLELSKCNPTDESYRITIDQYCGRREESGHRQSRRHNAEMPSRREVCRSSRLPQSNRNGPLSFGRLSHSRAVNARIANTR